jgi:hypothetical protein
MRVREGFISNSSSSSFVMIAIRYDRDILTDELIEKVDASGFSIKYDDEQGWSDPKTFLIGDNRSIDDDATVFSVDDIQLTWNDIHKFMDDIPGKNVIVTGTEVS